MLSQHVVYPVRFLTVFQYRHCRCSQFIVLRCRNSILCVITYQQSFRKFNDFLVIQFDFIVLLLFLEDLLLFVDTHDFDLLHLEHLQRQQGQRQHLEHFFMYYNHRKKLVMIYYLLFIIYSRNKQTIHIDDFHFMFFRSK